MIFALPNRQRWRFVWLTLTTLLGVALALALGRWQLLRADEKANLQAAIQAQKQLPALDTVAVARQLHSSQALSDLQHRTVMLQGRWLSEHTVFLDNRQMQGKPGFFVFTPLQLADSSATLVVQRGWVARNFTQRAVLPEVTTSAGLVAVNGRLAPPPSKLWEFSGPSEAGTSRIRQNLDLAQYSAQVGTPLARVTVIETVASNASDGLQRNWLEVGNGVAKHHGYAAQWFALAALIAALYVWLQWFKPRRARHEPAPSVAPPHENNRA